jgi:hypothetical protein
LGSGIFLYKWIIRRRITITISSLLFC